MHNFFGRLIPVLLATYSVLPASARQVDTIESYGIYVVTEKGFVKVAEDNRNNNEFYNNDSVLDFNHLNEFEFAKRADQTLKLIVYAKDFKPGMITLELRPIDIEVDIRPVNFSAKPLARADMHELTLDKPVKDGNMLRIHSGLFSRGFGVIVLGDTQAELVKYFSRKDLPASASIVKQYLDDARVAFPNNAELKKLAVHWDKAALTEKDKKGYSYVEEKWLQYQGAEKLKLKARYLEELIGEINGYLNEHPNGYKAAEAKQRKQHAEEKLKEYEKQL